MMATDLSFVPGRNARSENPTLNGFRFILNIKKNEPTYWKCALFRTGCSARITTVDKQLVFPVPAHSHEVQHAGNTVHIAKQTLKWKASQDLEDRRGSGMTNSCRGLWMATISTQIRRTIWKLLETETWCNGFVLIIVLAILLNLENILYILNNSEWH